MNRMLKIAAKIAVLVALCAANSSAAPLTTMIQGYLTTPDGNPYVSPQSVQFKVFQGGQSATAGSGTLVYDETATVTPLPSGVFNYALGSGNPNGGTLVVDGQARPNVLSTATYDTSQRVFVEFWIAGKVLLPRLELMGVPYAVVSAIAENLKPGSQINTTGLVASWVRVNSTDTTKPSLIVSTSIKVEAGGVYSPFFEGKFHGDGSALANVTASSISAANVQPGTLSPGVLLPTAQLTGGPIAAGLLPGTVAHTTTANDFSATQTISAPGGLRVTNGLQAGSGAFTATGDAQYSLKLSSGLEVSGGGVTAPYLQGTLIGDGSRITGVQASAVSAGNVQPGTLAAGVLLPTGQLTGIPIATNLLPASVAYTTSPNEFTASQTMSAAGGMTVSGSALPAPKPNTLSKENISRAWVNFDGSPASCPNIGDACAIRSGFNVASVTRAAVGAYTINWKTPFADEFYAPTGSCQRMDSTAAIMFQIGRGAAGYPFTPTTARVGCGNYDGYPVDASIVAVQAMGNQ